MTKKCRPLMSRRALLGVAAALPLAARGATLAGDGWSGRKKYKTVDGRRMAYIEIGEGDPIVFLHGNPTSSYLWRKIIPHVQDLGRCIAPDLVGMGDSEKLRNSGRGVYTYVNHRRYLFGLLKKLGVEQDVTLVIHDWGSALGFDWAWQKPERVRGIAYMEALLRPPERTDDPEPSPFFKVLKSDQGEKAILEDNMFLKGFFREVGLYLGEDDVAEYLRPFAEPGEGRRPMLTWPREIPFAGQPAENDRVIRGYSRWLVETEMPKLLIQGNPGLIFSVDELRRFARSLPNQKIVQVYGGHFLQEVSGDAIGRALREWMLEI